MTRSEILNTAEKCVCGQREQDYGSPENNFQLIADLWGAYYGQKFTPVDVAMMMALLKMARIKTGTGTEDSFVDAAGYFACGGEIATNYRVLTKPSFTDICTNEAVYDPATHMYEPILKGETVT